MSISKEQLENRKKVIQDDINTAKQRIVDIEKKKTEDVALINALQGALQPVSYTHLTLPTICSV